MYDPSAEWTEDELESAAAILFQAAGQLRNLGRYNLAAQVRSCQMTLDQSLLRRRSERMRDADRQLSLVPPGTYDHAS